MGKNNNVDIEMMEVKEYTNVWEINIFTANRILENNGAAEREEIVNRGKEFLFVTTLYKT